jgi:hypothetical protein
MKNHLLAAWEKDPLKALAGCGVHEKLRRLCLDRPGRHHR